MAFEVDELNASRRQQHTMTACGITVLQLAPSGCMHLSLVVFDMCACCNDVVRYRS